MNYEKAYHELRESIEKVLPLAPLGASFVPADLVCAINDTRRLLKEHRQLTLRQRLEALGLDAADIDVAVDMALDLAEAYVQSTQAMKAHE